MAEIKPFRGWRYSAKAGDMKDLISPLQDAVGQEELQRLYALPFNSIHLSVPAHHSPGELVSSWKKDQLLLQDELPSLYVYYQYFTLPESPDPEKAYCRKGFICNLRLYHWEENQVLKHESTMAFSVEDKVRLLEETRLHITPIQLLYSDPDCQLEKWMDEAVASPLYSFRDMQGTLNTFGVITRPEVISHFIHLIENQRLILADGHHRYTAGLDYLDKQKQKETGYSPGAGYNFISAYMTNMDSEAIKVLPTHRILKRIPHFREEHFLVGLQEFFHLSPVETEKIVPKLAESPKSTFGLILRERQYLLQLRDEVRTSIRWNFPDLIKELDLTVLHYFIIEKVLKIKGKEQKDSKNIEFSAIFMNCVREVRRGNADAAIITRDISMEEIKKVCFSGYTFPQKSTFFYPKITTGFVFSSIIDH